MNDLPSLAICVLTNGFVYVGQVAIGEAGFLSITGARCVRKWGTSKGLGELAETGPLKDTALDHPCRVHAPLTALIHFIACRPEAWAKLYA